MDPLPYTGKNRRRAIVFALVGNVVPISIAVIANGGTHRWPFYAGAIVACIAPLVVTVLGRRHLALFWVAAFSGIPAVTAMQSYTGGVSSGYTVLVMMPMVWFGLQATQREVMAALAILTAASFGPMLVIGAPSYPVDWGHATLLVLIGSSVAAALHVMSRETARLAARLRSEATLDDLTGVLNRRGWRDAAVSGLARAQRDGSRVGIIAIDLNDFKGLNDSMGHDTGDHVLVQTAERLRATIRQGDLLARLGRDEFVAMLANTTLTDTLLTVERLRELTPPLGAFAAGVALWNGAEELPELLRRADIALYEAKTTGSRVAVAPQMLPAAL
jgi:diguanylate cyclase (GGDEF)-like protein